MRSKLRTLPYVLLLLPFDLIVALYLFTFIPYWFSIRRKQAPLSTSPNGPSATIIVVNWDGKHLLADCLPAVVEAVRQDGRNHDIVVVDNGSTDGSVDFVRQTFKGVRVLALDRNYGYGGGNHRGIQEARSDVVVLLNNDMVVDRQFLGPLLDGFRDPSVFAVSSQIFFADPERRREETGNTHARFERGFFYLWHEDVPDKTSDCIPVFWAGGGSCAIDRNKYLAIGGFDPLFEPFYLEDTDLSYQAWKRGWKCLLAPESRVVHKHRSTTQAKFGRDFVERTIRKNQYLFLWKNVTGASMILEHLVNLPRIHASAILEHGPEFELRAYFRAFRQLIAAVRRRWENASQNRLSDREVLERSRQTQKAAPA
jgi:GT2 family glycosyltransferase